MHREEQGGLECLDGSGWLLQVAGVPCRPSGPVHGCGRMLVVHSCAWEGSPFLWVGKSHGLSLPHCSAMGQFRQVFFSETLYQPALLTSWPFPLAHHAQHTGLLSDTDLEHANLVPDSGIVVYHC